MNTPANLWLFVIFVVSLTALAAVIDVQTRRIPNSLTVLALSLALVFHTVTGGWAGLVTSLAGFATGFGVLLVLWLVGGGGGGDVKLMGALGAWFGATHILLVFLLSAAIALAGTLLILAIEFTSNLMFRTSTVPQVEPPTTNHRAHESADNALPESSFAKRSMPYALPVALAAWAMLAWKIILVQI